MNGRGVRDGACILFALEHVASAKGVCIIYWVAKTD